MRKPTTNTAVRLDPTRKPTNAPRRQTAATPPATSATRSVPVIERTIRVVLLLVSDMVGVVRRSVTDRTRELATGRARAARVRTARVAAAVTDLLGGFGELAALFLSALGREGEVVVCLDELLLTVFGEQHV